MLRRGRPARVTGGSNHATMILVFRVSPLPPCSWSCRPLSQRRGGSRCGGRQSYSRPPILSSLSLLRARCAAVAASAGAEGVNEDPLLRFPAGPRLGLARFRSLSQPARGSGAACAPPLPAPLPRRPGRRQGHEPRKRRHRRMSHGSPRPPRRRPQRRPQRGPRRRRRHLLPSDPRRVVHDHPLRIRLEVVKHGVDLAGLRLADTLEPGGGDAPAVAAWAAEEGAE